MRLSIFGPAKLMKLMRIKPKNIGVNPLYPRHPRSINLYIHLITALGKLRTARSGRRVATNESEEV